MQRWSRAQRRAASEEERGAALFKGAATSDERKRSVEQQHWSMAQVQRRATSRESGEERGAVSWEERGRGTGQGAG